MATEVVWADTDKTVYRDLSTGQVTETWTNTSGKGYATANTLATTEATNTAAAATAYGSLGSTIAPGKRVIWEDGKTYINISRLTLPSTASPTLRPAAWVPDLPRFALSSYGASANGTTDDSTAIQAAITAANAAGGGLVECLPGATYLIDQLQPPTSDYSSAPVGLLWKSNVHLLGNGATFKAKPRADLSSVNLILGHFASNISLRNITLLGDRRTRTTPVADGVDVSYALARFIECDHVTLDRVHANQSVGVGIDFRIISINLEGCSTTLGSAVVSVPNSGDNVYRLTRLKVGELVNTEIVDTFPAGTTVVSVNNVSPRSVTLSQPATASTTGLFLEFSPATDQKIVVRDCTFDDNRFNGLVIESGRGYTVERSTFTNTQGTSPAAGIDIEPYYGTAFLFDVTVRQCHFSGNSGGGIFVQNMTNAVLEDNAIDDYVMYRAVQQGVFRRNISGGNGLVLKMAAVDIADNVFTGAGISIYHYAVNQYRNPLDVSINKNRFQNTTGATALTLFNVDNDPAEYRALTLNDNTYVASGSATSSTALIGRDSFQASFATIEVARNTWTTTNPLSRTDVFRMPKATTSLSIANNTVTLNCPTMTSNIVIFNCTAQSVAATSNAMTEIVATTVTAFSGTVTGSGNTLNGSPVGP